VSHGAKVWVALATVYVLWGSTYLGIELTGETIPPLFAVAIRFIAAGLLLAAITYVSRGRSAFRLDLPEIRSAVLVGALLTGANAVLFVAERHVATGLASLIIGSVPLWLVVLRTANGDRPSAAALAAVLVGFGGLALLVHPSGGASVGYLLLVLCSAVMWALGAYLTTRLPMPADTFAGTAVEMFAGGLLLLPIGVITTSPHPSEFSARSIFGWIYLVTFGSVVGLTAFVWLLDNAPLGLVATYAYVNPIVAIALGIIVLHESLTWTVVAGAGLVLACVAVVVRGDRVPAQAEAMAAGAAGRECVSLE
jgi:drug/metabolite transporter (DMT)-like permease